jgi:tRNA(Ile)-lysidine synthase
MALLLAVDELIKSKRLLISVTAAHLNHGLRGETGEDDSRWVMETAHDLGLDAIGKNENVRELARVSGDNLEQAARRARYRFLLEVTARTGASAVLTAHTMEDQAETVLLRLMRGSGIEGLGGMSAVRVLDNESQILLVRPLLRWARRADTERYCDERAVDFRTDVMNKDESFNRVRVRRQLLPLMETFNGRIVETLSRTAELLQRDSSALEVQSEELLRLARTDEMDGTKALRVEVLAHAHESVRRRALRKWIKVERGDVRRLELVHLIAVEKLVFGERGGRKAELPGGSSVLRKKGLLLFSPSEKNTSFT